MSETKEIALTAPDGNLVSVAPETLSAIGGLDLKSIAFLIIRPLLIGALSSALDSKDLEDLELTETQKSKIEDVLIAQVDKVINKVK